jgi:transposase-like protein
MAYLWLTGCCSNTILLQTGHSPNTVADYLNHFRQLIGEMVESDDTMIGGDGIIVQIDETKMGKRKYHRGHRVDGAWVLVGIEMTPERRVFAEVVADRAESTLVNVISRHVCSGSTIWTDKWKSYTSLSRIFDVTHQTVNHSECFKDPVTGVNTNMVEGTNYAIKRSVAPRNRTIDCLPQHLLEFVWRRKNQHRLWDAFFDALRSVDYPRQ